MVISLFSSLITIFSGLIGKGILVLLPPPDEVDFFTTVISISSLICGFKVDAALTIALPLLIPLT